MHNPDFLTSKISGDGFLIQRFFNPVSLAPSGDPRAAVQIHEVTAQARADDPDGLRRSALLLSHGEAAHLRQDPRTRRAGHRYRIIHRWTSRIVFRQYRSAEIGNAAYCRALYTEISSTTFFVSFSLSLAIIQKIQTYYT